MSRPVHDLCRQETSRRAVCQEEAQRLTSTHAATSATCTAYVDIFSLSKVSARSLVVGPGSGLVAIAAETTDNSAATTAVDQLADVFLIGQPT